MIAVNKSTDNGHTFSAGIVVKVDNGSDKDWLAVGPDPAVPSRDNVYVTWTSFQNTGAQLWFAKSTDGGATWTSKPIFAPVTNLPWPISFSFPTQWSIRPRVGCTSLFCISVLSTRISSGF